MGGLSIWHILVVAVLFMLLFGRGKISEVMGDVAKGIKNFRQGMADEPKAAPPAPQLEVKPPVPPMDVTTARPDGTKVQ